MDSTAVRNAYDSAYRDVLAFLAERDGNPAFEYRGIHWNRALRKPLMDYAYPARLQGLWNGRSDVSSSATPIATAASPVSNGLKIRSKEDWAPRRLEFGLGNRADLAVFADPDKIERVLRHLRPGRVIHYTNAVSPGRAMRTLGTGAGFYQRALGDADRAEYASKAARIVETAFGGSQNSELGHRARGFAEKHLPKILFDTDRAFEFFERCPNVKAVLLDEDATTSKNAFAQVARIRGVRSFVLCHGVLGHPNGFLPLEADFFLAWGEAQKQKLIGWGAPAERVIVTGCSRYEPYAALDAAEVRRRVARRHRWDPAKPIGILAPPLFVPGRYAWEKEMLATVERMLTAAAEASQVQWIVKLHAGDPREPHYRSWARSVRPLGRAVVQTTADPYPLILASDFVLAYYSTFAVDGFAMKRPVILMNDPYSDIYREYRPYGLFYDANRVADVTRAIRTILSDGAAANLSANSVARLACLNEGEGIEPASRRVARLLEVR